MYRSHLLRAKYASSSLDLSFERSGTYALVLLYMREKMEGSAVGFAAWGSGALAGAQRNWARLDLNCCSAIVARGALYLSPGAT